MQQASAKSISNVKVATLYCRAFDEYGVHALWSFRQLPGPTAGDALVVARELRLEGDMRARFLAEEIEAACRGVGPTQAANAMAGPEWEGERGFLFFPPVADADCGFVLHPIDRAVNTVIAAATRRSLRDLVGLRAIEERVLPLGAVIWAAIEKAPGFTPEGLIGMLRRNSNFPRIDWEALETSTPVNPIEICTWLRGALRQAEEFVGRMPSSKAGLLFLENGKVVQPDPSRLDSYQTHAGQRRGHWPSSPEIANAMLDHYRK